MIVFISTLFLALAQAKNERFLSWFMNNSVYQVEYILVTPENRLKFKIDIKAQELVKNGFNASRVTKVLIHGFLGEGDIYCTDFSQAYFQEKMDVNILCIDWEKLASGKDFFGPAKNAIKVGKHVGQKLLYRKLILTLGQKAEKIHVIGFSLGAHLAGQIGRTVQKKAGKIGRITGLDPAKYVKKSHQLSRKDAHFVDVIHTNSGDFLEGCLSIKRPLGHADFYPNGGMHQPGCQKFCSGFWGFFRCLGGLVDTCSHERSYYLYLDSITNPTVEGVECESYKAFVKGECEGNLNIPMGEKSFVFARKLDGTEKKFYLVTKAPSEASTSMRYRRIPQVLKDTK